MVSPHQGVEAVGQLEILRAENCSKLQGFLFSQPVLRYDVDEA